MRSLKTLLFGSLLSLFPFTSYAVEMPDFDYPQDVSKTALKDLDRAFKNGDGEQVVDAIVRFSLAQSLVSQEKMDTIVLQIESTIAREKRPEYKALLRFFEACMFDSYSSHYAVRSRVNPDEAPSSDYTEWDRAQFSSKVQELLRLSLADADALKAKPITDFKKVIICHEEQGVKYVPTLFDFLSLKSIELLNGNELSRNLANEIFDNWEAANANNIEPLLFVKEQRVLARSHYGNDDEFTKLYNQYKDTEYCGIFVQHLSNSSSKYALFKDYIERYPNAYYSPAIQNKIYDIEEQKVNLSVKQNVSSRDSLRISITNENVWNYKIKILRLPDTAKPDKDDWYNVKDFELVKAIDCKADADKFPFSKWGEVVMVEPLPYGRYLVIPSFVCKGELQEVVRVSPNDLISVYDIGSFFVSVKGEPKRIYTVDIKTGKPLQGVTVKAKGKEVLGETGADGCLVIPEKLKSASLYLSKGDDKYSPSVSYYKDDYYDRDNSRIGAHVYTDLGIYRPGETVNFNAMFYYADSETRGVLPGEKIRVVLRDANSKPIDTLYLNTDDFGRIEGKFVIPTDRMNGNYTLRFEKQSGYLYSTTHYIVVSEYKTPTFAVEFSNDRYNFVDKEPVKITGNVKTYSGIPLADTEVKLSLSRNEWSWRWWYPERNSKHLNDTIVKTDSNGDFTMEYSPELLGDHYYYSYTVNAMCTDDAGESHEASVNFIVGSRRGLEMASDVNYENDKPIKLPIEYNTTVENEKNVQCYYELLKYNGNELVKSGNFSSDNPVFDFTDVPSGEYRFKAKVLADDDASKISSRLVLYKLTDKSAPVANHPMWIPADRKRVDEKNVAHIYIGTSVPESHIYYIATSRKGKVGEGWLHYKPGIHDLKLQIPNDPEDYVEVKLASTYDFNTYDEELTLNSIVEREKLNITVTSFRDKLIPGTPEKWTFKILNAKNQPMRAAMFLGMTDKAINSIQDNTWSFSRPAISGNFPAYLSTHGYSGTAYNRMYWKERSKEENDFDLPDFNFYDMEPFGIRAYGYDLGGAMPGVLYKSSSKARVESVNYMVMEEAAAADFMEDSEMEMDEPNKNLENVEVRDHDVKTALWKPMLVTDANGDINISFDAPNFNTTWFLQAIAYNSDLVNDKFVKDVLSQKPVMVKSSLPRFVRQGDKVTLMANVQNSTEEALIADAQIELFDPRTGDVYVRKSFKPSLNAKGMEAVGVDWVIPDTIPFVGFRIKAVGNNCGDGEQVMVPVLSAISPVIETQPYFIDAATEHKTFALPQFPESARVTLEYCDNPTWYCITALPTIFDDNLHVATSLAHSLFAITVAKELANKDPKVGEAINYWKANGQDSTLVSMLERNSDLKIGTLLASPWLNEADRQTLRMSKLDELLDPVLMKAKHDQIVKALADLQMSDGGWTWFRYPDCESSIYTTGTVLEIIGELKHIGMLADEPEIDNMVARAIKYYDTEIIKIHKDKKRDPYFDYSGYTYVRSLFPQYAYSKDVKKLIKSTVNKMTKEWKKTSLNNKAFYAVTLWRNDKQKDAKNIIESIRQFALVKPELGMYWDNLNAGSWYQPDKVAVTSFILQAFNEIDPRTAEIDQIRKWILLMKQSNDWGSSSLAADAVYSLLATGSEWLERNETPTITLGDKVVEFSKIDRYLGYCRKTVEATPGDILTIDRTGKSPAWGAVYCQFTAPMTQIEANAIDEMSITKEYYRYNPDGSTSPAEEFCVGDKVRVRTIIKNNKDLDFVTVVDERPSCFEPVDQKSGYRYADRAYYYQETKDALTNLFFNWLDKGTHIISYDVYVTAKGEFSAGIATGQCQYAPQITAHSAGKTIVVKDAVK